MHPKIKYFETKEWPLLAAGLIHDRINAILRDHGRCNVILTGGRSADQLYTAWADLPAFQQLAGVAFYFGDERCVPPDHSESNYGMALRSLFQRGVPEGCSVFRMEADDPNLEAASRRYDELLPARVDVMLLGVGEDGHIASLFPGSAALREASRRVVSVVGPKPPKERLTITPLLMAQASSIFVLATGAIKAAVLIKALQAAGDFDSLPARLVLNATWLLDRPLHGDTR
jgi:6-phosphogluconolactonase